MIHITLLPLLLAVGWGFVTYLLSFTSATVSGLSPLCFFKTSQICIDVLLLPSVNLRKGHLTFQSVRFRYKIPARINSKITDLWSPPDNIQYVLMLCRQDCIYSPTCACSSPVLLKLFTKCHLITVAIPVNLTILFFTALKRKKVKAADWASQSPSNAWNKTLNPDAWEKSVYWQIKWASLEPCLQDTAEILGRPWRQSCRNN